MKDFFKNLFLKDKDRTFICVILAVITAAAGTAFYQKHYINVLDSKAEAFNALVNSEYVCPILSRPCVSSVDQINDLSIYKTEDGQYGMLPYPDYKALDYVDLGDYLSKEISIPVAPEVTETMVDEGVESGWQQMASDEVVTEGDIADGDVVSLAIEVASAADAESEEYAKDFEFTEDSPAVILVSESMVGRYAEAVGEELNRRILEGCPVDGTFEIEITEHIGDNEDETDTSDESIEENTGVSDDSEVVTNDGDGIPEVGETLSYTLACRVLKVTRVPEMTDEFVKVVSDGTFENIDDYRAHVRSGLEEESSKLYMESLIRIIEAKLISACRVREVPPEVVDWFISVKLSQYAREAHKMLRSDVDAYIAEQVRVDNIEDAFAVFRNEALNNNKADVDVIVKAIAEKEDIAVSDSDMSSTLDDLAEDMTFSSAEDLLSSYGEPYVRRYAEVYAVYQWLIGHCNLVVGLSVSE